MKRRLFRPRVRPDPATGPNRGTTRLVPRLCRSSQSVVRPLQENVMRPLRYSINVTLDGCCDHRAGIADEDLHRNAAENINQADALLFGRVTYEMMEAAWRLPAREG